MGLIWATSAQAPSLTPPPFTSAERSLARIFGIRDGDNFSKRDWGQVEQAGGAQFVYARQLVQAVEAEMHEEVGRRHPEKGATRAGPPALRAHPAGLHQRVDRSLAEGDAAD